MTRLIRGNAVSVSKHVKPIQRTKVAYVHRGIEPVEIRRFDPARDSFDELTDMLHRAFARLGAMGLDCTCVDQSVSVTRSRAMRGDCHVAVSGASIVGTMTLEAPDRVSQCELYRRDDVASVRQIGIDPAWQKRGIGTLMLALADHWAATRGYAELALDTPHAAAHLIAFYRSQGFRIADCMRFDGKHYESAILCKPAVASRALATWSRRIALPRNAIAHAA